MRRLTSKNAYVFTALVFATAATALFACTSADDAPPTDDVDAAGNADSRAADGGTNDADAAADADADVVDDDDFVVPDAAVVCEATPCVTSLAGSFDGFVHC